MTRKRTRISKQSVQQKAKTRRKKIKLCSPFEASSTEVKTKHGKQKTKKAPTLEGSLVGHAEDQDETVTLPHPSSEHTHIHTSSISREEAKDTEEFK